MRRASGSLILTRTSSFSSTPRFCSCSFFISFKAISIRCCFARRALSCAFCCLEFNPSACGSLKASTCSCAFFRLLQRLLPPKCLSTGVGLDLGAIHHDLFQCHQPCRTQYPQQMTEQLVQFF